MDFSWYFLIIEELRGTNFEQFFVGEAYKDAT